MTEHDIPRQQTGPSIKAVPGSMLALDGPDRVTNKPRNICRKAGEHPQGRDGPSLGTQCGEIRAAGSHQQSAMEPIKSGQDMKNMAEGDLKKQQSKDV